MIYRIKQNLVQDIVSLVSIVLLAYTTWQVIAIRAKLSVPQCCYQVIYYEQSAIMEDDSTYHVQSKIYDQVFLNEENAVFRANEILNEADSSVVDSTWVVIQKECL